LNNHTDSQAARGGHLKRAKVVHPDDAGIVPKHKFMVGRLDVWDMEKAQYPMDGTGLFGGDPTVIVHRDCYPGIVRE
jgi:hypothetical protein